MRRLFPFMRLGSFIYWMIGVFAWVITIGLFIVQEVSAVRTVQELSALTGIALTVDHYAAAILPPLGTLIVGFLAGLGILVVSDLLKLLIRIEENTRITQLTLRQRRDGTQRPVTDYPHPTSTWSQSDRVKPLPRIDKDGVQPPPVEDWQRPAVPKVKDHFVP